MEPTTVIISLLSGLVGAVLASIGTLLAVYLNSRLEKERYQLQWKREVLARLVGNLYLLTAGAIRRNSGALYVALNEAYVAFDDAPPVLDALGRLQENPNENNIVTVVKSMAKSSGVNFDGLNDRFITHPFSPPACPEG